MGVSKSLGLETKLGSAQARLCHEALGGNNFIQICNFVQFTFLDWL